MSASTSTPFYCTNCNQRQTHSVPVNTSHSTTGESGCPNCQSPDLVPVVFEHGDSRTVSGGYIPSSKRETAVELNDFTT